jgi:DNA-binding NarL/FixJ family response regulator
MAGNLDHAAGAATLRLLYVEDDPALRSLLAQRLEEHEAVAGVVVAADPAEAVAAVEGGGIDAALLDLALGDWQLNGFELGLALRTHAKLLPIVMFSQHPAARIEDVLPVEERHHWSYVRKHGQIDIGELVATVQRTCLGVPQFEAAGAGEASAAASVLQRLSPRQREIMALAATGLDARAIADQVHLTHVSVRRELSRAYKILVPTAGAGTDLRTAAVLEYLRASGGTGSGVR